MSACVIAGRSTDKQHPMDKTTAEIAANYRDENVADALYTLQAVKIEHPDIWNL